MSLKYRSSDGTETPVAGLAPAGQLVPSVALQQSGTAPVTISGDLADYPGGELAVTFDTAMPDADYQVEYVTVNAGAFSISTTSKSATGFTAIVRNLTGGVVPGSSVTIKWTAFKLMTDTVHEADAARIAQNTANFAPAFSEVTSYAVGDYCTYNSILYRCTTAHTAGVWVAGHFTQVTVGSQLKVQDISASITRGDGYASGQIHVFRDGNTVQVVFNSVMTTGYSKTICSGLPRPLHISYFCVQADEVPQELGLGSLLENGSIVTGAETAGMGPSKIWDGFITYLTRD